MFIFRSLMRRPVAVPALAMVLALTAAPAGAGADEIAAAAGAPVAADHGKAYVCNDLAASHPDPRWDDMPLTIIAAPGKSLFFGDVRATVTDETGVVLFDAFCEAPLLTAGLPSGER